MTTPMPEPVAEIMEGFSIFWAGAGPIKDLIDRTGAKIGDRLITTDQAEAYAEARVREVQQWVNVEDRLPAPETDVLVKVDGKFGARTHDIAGLFRDEWMSQITEDIVRGCVTHWMPLPAPPQ